MIINSDLLYECRLNAWKDCCITISVTGLDIMMTIRLPKIKNKLVLEELRLPYDSLKLRFRPDPASDVNFLPALNLETSRR